MVKMSREQLRRVISEAVNRKLEEVGLSPPGPNEFVEVVGDAIISEMMENDMNLANNAYEMVMGTIDDETFVRPARYEDVDEWAHEITDKVLSSEELKYSVFSAAQQVLKNLMRPE
jgi:hypothetical protein